MSCNNDVRTKVAKILEHVHLYWRQKELIQHVHVYYYFFKGPNFYYIYFSCTLYLLVINVLDITCIVITQYKCTSQRQSGIQLFPILFTNAILNQVC